MVTNIKVNIEVENSTARVSIHGKMVHVMKVSLMKGFDMGKVVGRVPS